MSASAWVAVGLIGAWFAFFVEAVLFDIWFGKKPPRRQR